MPTPLDHDLHLALDASLDGLLDALQMRPVDDDTFRVPSEPNRFNRIYGGQMLAQALRAASETVEGKEPSALHAAFVAAGEPDTPVDLLVDRVRDGRSMSTRSVTVAQSGRTLLIAFVSFHANEPGPVVHTDAPAAPHPSQLPLVQDWVAELPAELEARARGWLVTPPPIEIRMGEAPTFLGGSAATGTRPHWMRLHRDVGQDPALHTALLAYASDYFLIDVVFRSHPDGGDPGSLMGSSLDHAIWFHRPTRFDRWHLFTQESLAIDGDRGLARGTIHDAGGHLVATVMQEVLIRPL